MKKLLKKAQSEVITTILLILISIIAVSLLSMFVIKMVRDNLAEAECFKTLGKLNIDLNNEATFFNTASMNLSISIERAYAGYNLTGIAMSLGNEKTTKSIIIKPGTLSGVCMYDGSSNLILPGNGGRTTYIIDSRSIGLNLNITYVAISPIIGRQCDKVNEAQIPQI